MPCLAREGHVVTGFSDGTGTADIQLMPGALDEASPYLEKQPDTSARFDRVVDLIRGFESPYGLELLSTAHWVAEHEGAATAERAIELIQARSPRKKGLFTGEHISGAWARLSDQGWIEAEDAA